MEEMVWKLELQDDKAKQKAIGAVSGLSGVDTIILDNKEKKLIAIADIDHEYPPPMSTYYARVGAGKGELGGCVIC